MSRSIMAALLLSMTALLGCEGPKAAPAARVPYPPLPADRKFPVQLGLVTTSLETITSKSTDESLPNPAKIAADSEAKTLAQLANTSDGKVDLELSGPTYTGDTFDWSDYRGRVVIVFFWASDYPTCREDLTNLEEVRKFYRYQPLEVVTVNLDADFEQARKFLEVAQPSFPVIMDGEQDFEMLRKYPTRSVPALICVNKTGQIVDANFSEPRLYQHMLQLIQAPYNKPLADLPMMGGVATTETETETETAEASAPQAKKKPTRTTTKTSAEAKQPRKTAKPSSDDEQPEKTSAPLSDDEQLVEAKVGAGKKGRGYGGDIYTEPLKARWRAEEKLIFDVRIPKAMSLFRATNNRLPESHEEFMTVIIEENAITLPELPAGQEFIYVPAEGKLMIRQPKK